MKSVILCNAIVMSVFALSVTAAAIYFNNASILWWYMVLPFLGYGYKETQTKKGATDERAKCCDE